MCWTSEGRHVDGLQLETQNKRLWRTLREYEREFDADKDEIAELREVMRKAVEELLDVVATNTDTRKRRATNGRLRALAAHLQHALAAAAVDSRDDPATVRHRVPQGPVV